MRPLQYAVYKGVGGKFGAVQFSFQSPHYFHERQKDFTGTEALYTDTEGRTKMREGWGIREGAVFLEMASTVGKNQYDWEHKVVLALSVDDIGKFLNSLTFGEDLEILHDPGAGKEAQGQVKKYLNVKFVDKAMGCLLGTTRVSGGERVSHTVPISRNEIIVLRALFTAAISRALAWS